MIRFRITPQEATIIEASLRGSSVELEDRRSLLLEIGKVLVEDKPATLQLSFDEIWFLRDYIEPDRMVGSTSGLDIITRIYKALVGVKMPTDKLVSPGTGGALVEVKNGRED
jgi:hypothetical protein